MEGHHRTTVAVDASDWFPQWSVHETRDLLAARFELDQTFLETKRNKVLWEVVARKMREKGYNRSAEQCKSKWKNLVTRYKGCETMALEGMPQQFPFYNELEAIFTARLERKLWIEAEGGSSSGTKNKEVAIASEDEDDNEEKAGSSKKKRKVHKSGNSPSSGENTSVLKETLEEFMKQQMQIEMEWLKVYEAREENRRVREMEWRQTMEALERERIVMERRWREREEQRRMREEARAEKRDALISTLLNKHRREDM